MSDNEPIQQDPNQFREKLIFAVVAIVLIGGAKLILGW